MHALTTTAAVVVPSTPVNTSPFTPHTTSTAYAILTAINGTLSTDAVSSGFSLGRRHDRLTNVQMMIRTRVAKTATKSRAAIFWRRCPRVGEMAVGAMDWVAPMMERRMAREVGMWTRLKDRAGRAARGSVVLFLSGSWSARVV
jgi:hypothetical protein